VRISRSSIILVRQSLNQTNCLPVMLDNGEQLLECIEAMLAKEAVARTKEYLTPDGDVDETCREAMVRWCFSVCDTFGLRRETVWIAFAVLDRYLSSGRGRSARVLEDKSLFQLTAITAFYTAVKITEPEVLGMEMLLKLCRGYYREEDVATTELEILSAIEFRVHSFASPIEYASRFLSLAEIDDAATSVILENARAHLERATVDYGFSTFRPSSVAVAVLGATLDETDVLSRNDIDGLWRNLTTLIDVEESRTAERMLLARSTSVGPRRRTSVSLQKTPRSTKVLASGDTSPVSTVC